MKKLLVLILIFNYIKQLKHLSKTNIFFGDNDVFYEIFFNMLKLS